LRVKLEVETHDNTLVFDLLEVKETKIGMEKQLAADVTVRYDGTLIRRAAHVPAIVKLTLEIASLVGSQVAASWIYDKLKSRDAKLRIGNREVTLEKEEITRAVQEGT
jgi:molybdenum cofactor biosynthesis enzyme